MVLGYDLITFGLSSLHGVTIKMILNHEDLIFYLPFLHTHGLGCLTNSPSCLIAEPLISTELVLNPKPVCDFSPTRKHSTGPLAQVISSSDLFMPICPKHELKQWIKYKQKLVWTCKEDYSEVSLQADVGQKGDETFQQVWVQFICVLEMIFNAFIVRLKDT